MAAHQFLERNDLSQMFLDQVVDFILKNTKGVTIGQQAPSAGDPFTGESIIIKHFPSHPGAATDNIKGVCLSYILYIKHGDLRVVVISVA